MPVARVLATLRNLRFLAPTPYRPRLKRLYYAAVPTATRRTLVAEVFRGAAAGVASGSPLYQLLLRNAAADVQAGGPCWTVLESYRPAANAGEEMLSSKFMAAVHQIVLEDRAPGLAAYYPSVGGDASDLDGSWEAFRDAVAEHPDRLRELVARPVQTNEVGRCRVLAGAFLHVAERTGLPLRIFELGASAGLILRWDHYRYELGSMTWGDPGSAVRLRGELVAGRPPFDRSADVVARAGCDRAPVDVHSETARLGLMSYVRADQPERVQLLRNALEVARQVPVKIDDADAVEWAAAVLATQADGLATVLFESYVMKYLPPAGQNRLLEIVKRAGSAAKSERPFAFLRMGAGPRENETAVTIWPGDRTSLLATSDQYGRRMRWLVPAAAAA